MIIDLKPNEIKFTSGGNCGWETAYKVSVDTFLAVGAITGIVTGSYFANPDKYAQISSSSLSRESIFEPPSFTPIMFVMLGSAVVGAIFYTIMYRKEDC